jgi:hypothetical protein
MHRPHARRFQCKNYGPKGERVQNIRVVDDKRSPELDDASLVDATQRDRAAFDLLYRRYVDRVSGS